MWLFYYAIHESDRNDWNKIFKYELYPTSEDTCQGMENVGSVSQQRTWYELA